jgi:cytochrome c oxidase subunit 3
MGTVATRKPRAKPSGMTFGPGGSFGGGGDGGGIGGRHLPSDTYRLGILFALAGIAMLFIAMTSAYVVRHGLDPDWRAIRMPSILLINTAVLLASSVTMEKARHSPGLNRWLAATLLLGLAFLGGQLIAWQQLSAKGIYLSTNPHSSFFYLLTGIHGLHLLGGIVAFSYLLLTTPGRRTRAIDAAALYWHFMDGLWVYLLVLLFRWR